ncbi:hypothetical protein ACIBHX_50070 [Nonomuraea sp. NPDC050536]|uniref:hypothetical protein n=1 Tax=Nonomuraea sp. NPDC050536 TaxID=3364366 RepID=UPI0037C809A8
MTPRSIDDLIEPISRAVEPLQAAAILESAGLDDRIARERYGHPDVFALAEAVYSRIVPMIQASGGPPRRARPIAQMAHGLLYAMPAALLPAAGGLVGRQWLMPGLVLTTGIGWVLGSAAAQLAYSYLGRDAPGAAGRVLRTGLVIGVAVAAVTVSALGPVTLVALCVTQMAFQLSSGILLFYRREGLLAALMLPAVLAGAGYIAIGNRGAALLAVCLGVVCVAAVSGAAILLTLGRVETSGVPLRTLAPSIVYSVLTAAFLLQAEGRYVLDRADLAVAGAGLVLGMGVLEYRAHTFEDEARRVIREVRYPREFTRRTRLLLGKGLLICLGVLSALSAVPLTFLYLAGSLTRDSVLMAAAHVVVGAAYFLAFLLGNQGKIRLLCAAQALVLAVHPGARALWPDVPLFLAAGLLFLVILLILALHSLRDVRQYR